MDLKWNKKKKKITESSYLEKSNLHENTTQSFSKVLNNFQNSELSNVSMDKDNAESAECSSKRKRAGRPRLTESKNKMETGIQVLTEKRERKKVDYSALLGDFDDYGSPLPRKSRGRPKTLVASTPIIDSKPLNEKSVARKRGRPKKNVTANEESYTSSTNNQQKHINGAEQTKHKSEVESKIEFHNLVNISENFKKQERPKQINDESVVIQQNGDDDKGEMTENGESITIEITFNNDQTENDTISKDTEQQLSASDSSEVFLIKRRGRPNKKKRGRKPKKASVSDSEGSYCASDSDNHQRKKRGKRARVLDSDEEGNTVNGEQDEEKSFLNLEGLNKEHEDLRGTEVTKPNSRVQSSNSSDEELSLNAVKKQMAPKVQGRRKGLVYHRKEKKLEDKPYKHCTQMLKTVLQQSGHGAAEVDENSSIDNSSQNTICMICKESIPNVKWDRHKKKVHYDLAWCAGEYALDIHDEDVIFDTLKRLRKAYGVLECNKCGMKGTRPREFWQHVEKCCEIVSPSGMVTCAVCNEAVVRTAWNNHRYKNHNNLAWRVGEPSIDLSDQNLVVHILNKIYKERKPMTCEKCGKVVKSVVGFLSHKSICQKTDAEIMELKLECQICTKMVLPVSMETHQKIHQQEKIENFDLLNEQPSRRKAADKAMQVINKFVDNSDVSASQIKDARSWYLTEDDLQRGVRYRFFRMKLETFLCIFSDCFMEFSAMSDCLDHLKWCEKRPEKILVCKICLKVCENESKITEHLRDVHKKINVVNKDDEHNEDEENHTLEDNDTNFEINAESEDDNEIIVELDPAEVINKYHKREKSAFEKKCLASNEKYAVKPDFLQGDFYNGPYNVVYAKAFNWMLRFASENFSNATLFPNLTNLSSWMLLDCDLLDSFLPKATESCDVVSRRLKNGREKCTETDLEFRKLELFEAAQLNEDDVTIFCGGPISALAWLPTPFDEENHSQVLAVAVLNDMDSKYLWDCLYYEPYLIQLWDYGVLKNRQDKIELPSVMYSIAVNFGPIWHMEWCPSGCFLSKNDKNRLGLLAVAASDSFVYIFSVDKVPEDQRGSILKGNPCLKLQLMEANIEMENVQNYYATKISWTKASGHRYIAVGYSNGCVAIFDLEMNEKSFLRNVSISGHKLLFPYLKFQPQVSSPVTALCLSHLDEGNTWLLVGNYEKDVGYWNLRTLACVSSVQNVNPGDGVWMTQWLSSAFCEDRDGIRLHESLTAQKKGVYKGIPVSTSVWSPRDFMSVKAAMTSSFCSIKCLAFSDWINILIHGSYMGEIIANVSNQLARMIGQDSRRKGIRNCLFSRAKLIKKNKEDLIDCDNVINYRGTVNKYGLVFCDYDLSDTNFPKDFVLKNKVVEPELLQDTSTELYPLQAVNKIVFNPNHQACTFVVAGYHSGLVRLKHLKFVTKRHPRL